MIEEHLNFYFSDELICYLLFVKQLLFDYFEGTDKSCVFLFGEIYPTVFAIS